MRAPRCRARAPPATLPCTANASASSQGVAAASIIAFPAALNVTDAAPLLFLPAGAALNGAGVDVILASRAACAAYAALGGAVQCDLARAFATDAGIMFYLGAAAALGMVPAPACVG